MLKTTISLLAICALATPGFAQTAKEEAAAAGSI